MCKSNFTKLGTDESYCKGSLQSDVTRYSIGEALKLAAQSYGDLTALIEGKSTEDGARRWSFNELYSDSLKVAKALLTCFTQGQRIAIWASNSPEWVLIEYGASLAGLTLVTVNPAYQSEELKYVLNNANVDGVIVQKTYRGRDLLKILDSIKLSLPNLKTVISLSQWEEFLATERAGLFPAVAGDHMAQVQYTSGTTGFPKGACLTHLGLVNNGRFYAESIGAKVGDIWINAMPMFHTAGCGLATLGAFQTGGTLVMMPEFDAGLALDLFERERGTIMLCVPTMLLRIIEEQEKKPRNIDCWRLVTLGGAPVASELIGRAKKLLKLDVAIGYGQTETSPYLTHTFVNDPHEKWYETVGKPLPNTEIKIQDPSTGQNVKLNEPGEICAKSYGVMLGYLGNIEATEETIDTEGWLHTGDIGSMDEYGYIKVFARLKDMIIRGGENIYPREIEDLLFTHPDISNVAVLGLPDTEWGESVAACLITKSGVAVPTEELDKFCRAHLASYKVPRSWFFLESFPQTPSGKVQKFELRKIISAQSSVNQGA